ncbi:MAG: hypothetical protein AAFY02_19235 [Pseudomonadota bacterium]
MTLEEQKELARYQEKMKFYWEALPSKFLIAIIIIIIGLTANYLIEKYKSNNVKNQFLLESRLTALIEIRQKYDLVTDIMHKYAEPPKDTNRSDFVEVYEHRIVSYGTAVNKWSMLFSNATGKDFAYHFYIHLAVIDDSVEKNENTKAFLSWMIEHFDGFTKEALWENTGYTPDGTEMDLDFQELSSIELQTLDIGSFFRESQTRWEIATKQK